MKKFKSVIIISLSLLFSLGFLSSQAQKSVSLRYKLHEGKSFLTTSTIDQDIEMHMQGQVMTINQSITSDETVHIAKVDTKTIKTSQSIDKMTMKQSMAGQEFFYDSSDPTTYASGRGAQLGAAFNKLIKKTFSITIDKLGNIQSFDLANLTGPDGKVSDNVSSGNNFIIFPEKKVKPNDSWEADIKPLKGSKTKIHMKYTLLKLSGKKATIGLEGTITSNEEAGDNVPKIDGSLSGEATVDLRTGWTMESNMDQEIKMEVNQNGMTIPMTISSTVTKKSKAK